MIHIEQYHKVDSLEEAYRLLQKYETAVLLGGGAWIRTGSKPLEHVIDLKGLGLDTIIETKDSLSIGAMVSLRAMETHAGIRQLGGGFLSEALSQILGVAFRNTATVGGSIMGKFSFSDLLTPLLMLDVTLQFYDAGPMRLTTFLAQRGRLKDILQAITIEKKACRAMFKKVANTALDFSIVNVAVAIVEGRYRIAVGARPGTAILAESVMAWLDTVESPTEATWKEAGEKVVETIKLGTNQRAHESYRQQLVKTYVARGLKEVSGS
ncbi:MAG: hypothetical protein EA374_06355 [Acholeplasmatales bacterium]|nr:MAG: hypothetical protein EA374_06355 [Acholeplasmatales bacterium]